MWNSTKKGNRTIRRDKYLNLLINSKQNGFPKVITGIRRSGKSYLLNTIYKNYLIENVVYNELIYNDYKVNVGTFDIFENDENGKTTRKTLEVDFLASKGNRMYYIQVCDDYSSDTTKNRELKPYIALNDQIQKIIVVNKPIKGMRDEKGFTIIGVCEFLLRYIK